MRYLHHASASVVGLMLGFRWKARRDRREEPAPRVARVPEGDRVYAIGDVHGRLDLLKALLLQIEADTLRRGAATGVHIVFLGDLIDRGPESAQVIDFLISYRPVGRTLHFIAGNHEECFLDMLNGSTTSESGWFQFGGYETLQSYGVPERAIIARGAVLQQEMAERVPQAHIEFLSKMVDQVRIGDYLFVHAGIKPGQPLDRQNPQDLRWIREEFLEDPTDHGVVVVHGHSISRMPVVRGNRIGIDTGAYKSGRLTALGLEGDQSWFLATRSYEEDVAA